MKKSKQQALPQVEENTHNYSLSRLWEVLERRETTNRIAMILTIAAVICGFATYGALSATQPFGDSPATVLVMLNIDGVVMLLLAAIIARRVTGLWLEHKRGVVGAKLHARLALIFALLTALPSALMILFATFFFHYGIQTWFSERISTAVLESQVVAEAYLKEHKQVIRADILAMAQDLNRESSRLLENPKLFQEMIKAQSSIRNFSEVLVLRSDGEVMARAGLTFSLELNNPITSKLLKEAKDGDVILMTGNKDDKVQAFMRLDNYFDTYLLVGRVIEAGVLEHMKRTDKAVKEYSAFEVKKSQIQITITFLFVMVALLLLVAAVWLGLSFAHSIVQPITRMITAAEKVRSGDLSAKVMLDEGRANDDEIAMLAKAFNRMTKKLSDQHGALLAFNIELDDRRRFSEAVLSGVSAGVLGMDKEGIITSVNSSTEKLLDRKADDLMNKPLAEVLPSMEALRRMVRRRPATLLETELIFERGKDKEQRTFIVRIATEMNDNEIQGYVMTFDDISPLLSAQKNAAWADVARRIAHEIKNPLTPIQLAAERLQRRYASQITDDKETFDECVGTIIRKVDDLRNMVNEFSNFARMPAARLKRENIVRIIQENFSLFKQAETSIEFKLDVAEDQIWLMCDRQQVSQAVLNIVKNSVESVHEHLRLNEKKNLKGKIGLSVSCEVENKRINITVEDNGIGLPEEKRHQLTEPYVTTRENGTGLGLAIVKKIMDDHSGTVTLRNGDKQGAVVTLSFAYNEMLQNEIIDQSNV